MRNIARRVQELEKFQRQRKGALVVFRNKDETEEAAIERHCRERGVSEDDYQHTILLGWIDAAL